MAYNLSEKAIAEKYEDLLFTKVMALYAEEESEKILSELGEETADPKAVQKLFDKKERSENLRTLWKYSKKILQFAAMVVFVAVVSVSSVVVASAEVRETVAEAIYHLVLRKTDRYTEVSIGNSTGFIDPEIYTWDNAYGMTYVPKGFVCTDKQIGTINKMVTYSCDESFFIFSQSSDNTFARIDTEDADTVEKFIINNSEAIIVEKNGFCVIAWRSGDTFLSLQGIIEAEELIKVAEGIKPIGNSASEPEEEYTFVDPEHYNYENAYAPTYMTEEFVQTECNISSTYKIHTYTFGDKFIYIEQNGIAGGSHIDTENAQVVKEIVVNGSQALYVEKGGLAYITWSFPDALLFVCGNIDGKEIIKVAEGLKPLGYSASEPEAEYTFVDPEIYDWEGAYAPTYIPNGYLHSEIIDIENEKIIIYSKEETEIIFSQSVNTTIEKIDTEDAEIVKKIIIGDSEGLFVVKGDVTSIFWSSEETLLSIVGNADSDEMLKMAQGIKPVN